MKVGCRSLFIPLPSSLCPHPYALIRRTTQKIRRPTYRFFVERSIHAARRLAHTPPVREIPNWL